MNCPIDPEGTKCIVLPDEINEKTPSGLLWVPPEAKDQHQLAVTQGTLVAIGPRAEIAWNDPEKPGEFPAKEIPAKPGDRVIFVKYGGTIVQWGDVIYQLLQDQDIIGRMLEEAPVRDGLILTPKERDVIVPGITGMAGRG